jgi:2-oxo-4-hydroxy-4-carboxy--5-ureidoimidazoline (OHCU) decarboxylase
MSQVSRSEERGLDALTEYGWELVDEMAEEYDDQFGDDLLAGVPETDRTTVVGAVEDRLRDALFDGDAWTANYRRLRFAAVLDGE